MAGTIFSSITSYYTPDDRTRHAIVATTEGNLIEVFYNTQGLGRAHLACFDAITHIDGFYTNDDGNQNVIVAAGDDISQIYFHPDSINFRSLAACAGSLTAFYTPDDQYRHVICAFDGGIREIYFQSGTHSTINNVELRSPIIDIIGITGFYTPDDHNRHIVVADTSGNLFEINYPSIISEHFPQVVLAGIPNIIGIAGFYTPDDHNRHIIVATADGNLTEVLYHSPTDVHVSQLPLVNFRNIVGIGAFYSDDDHYRHVIVATADGNLTEVFYHSPSDVHVSQPPLVNFTPSVPSLQDLSPDPVNVDQATLNTLTSGLYSTSGRMVGIAGNSDFLYAFSDDAGVWKSVHGGEWVQTPGSPLKTGMPSPNLAVDPQNASHVVAGSNDGAWESMDAGVSWMLVFSPETVGCDSNQVSAIAFDTNSQLFLGVDCGIVLRQAPGQPFTLTKLPQNLNLGPVTAFAFSQTKTWARTGTALLESNTNGLTWLAPNMMPNYIQNSGSEFYTLAAIDNFAYMVWAIPGTSPKGCGAYNQLVIYDSANKNSANKGWNYQQVISHGTPTCDGTGNGGRRFVKSFIRNDPNLALVIGQRLELFYCGAQEIYQAVSLNEDGTVTEWDEIVGTQTFSNHDPVHADMWDFLIDVSVGGNTAWIAGDGGVYNFVSPFPFNFESSFLFNFLQGVWKTQLLGLHTHEIHTVTVLNMNPVLRSRLAYSTQDNSAWVRDTSPIVMPNPQWQASRDLGDVNFTVGDPSCPDYALLALHRQKAELIHYGSEPKPVTLLNYKYKPGKLLNTIGPDGPTTFQFIPSPKSSGRFTTVDAVMLVDLPLTYWDDKNGVNVPFFPPTDKLGESSNGTPVLLRNTNFDANPDINLSKGLYWKVQIASFPAGTLGFYVTGNRTTPIYYSFTQNTLSRHTSDDNWRSVTTKLVWEQKENFGVGGFGPAFVNPWDYHILYVLTDEGVKISTDMGDTLTNDTVLTTLVAGTEHLPMSTVSQIAFNYDNPSERVCGAQTGVFYSSGDGTWADLTPLLPLPRTPVTSVGIDCEGVYVATYGRSLLRIIAYKNIVAQYTPLPTVHIKIPNDYCKTFPVEGGGNNPAC